jgi:hypothetical protein
MELVCLGLGRLMLLIVLFVVPGHSLAGRSNMI